jgi:hypothetical protein
MAIERAHVDFTDHLAQAGQTVHDSQGVSASMTVSSVG